MTDRPIIMTPENVRLLIREAEQPGTSKRETRRLLYVASAEAREPTLLDGYPPHVVGLKGANWRPSGWHRTEPGDRLWVREGLQQYGGKTAQYIATCTGVPRNGAVPGVADGRALWQWKRPKLPSIHMPRWASRVTLLVVRVRIERLQDISAPAAVAEGMTASYAPAVDQYRALWQSLHNSPNSWADNPWVAAISFRPILCNIDHVEVQRTSYPPPAC